MYYGLLCILFARGRKIRVFKTKNFVRWLRKQKITEEPLNSAIEEVKQGLYDADLGGGLIKKRVARNGWGKRSGCRILLAFKCEERIFCVFGLAKKDRDDFDKDELTVFKN